MHAERNHPRLQSLNGKRLKKLSSRAAYESTDELLSSSQILQSDYADLWGINLENNKSLTAILNVNSKQSIEVPHNKDNNLIKFVVVKNAVTPELNIDVTKKNEGNQKTD